MTLKHSTERTGGPIALLDWDGTLRRGFTIREWVDHLAAAALIDAVARNRLAELFRGYDQGHLDHDSLADLSAQLLSSHLSGTSVANVLDAAHGFIEGDRMRLMPFTEGLIDLLQKRGIRTVIISGAPDEVLAAHQGQLPFWAHEGLALTTSHGRYDGGIRRNPGIATQKEAAIREMEGRGSSSVIAFGNSSSDIPLWRAAQLRFSLGRDAPAPAVPRLIPITGSVSDLAVIDAMIRTGGVG